MEAQRRRAWLATATDRGILSRSVVTCLIVGALLTVINHGDQLIRGAIDWTLAWQVGLTFVVPFLVATTSAAAAIQSRVSHEPEVLADSGIGKDPNLDLDTESEAALRQ